MENLTNEIVKESGRKLNVAKGSAIGVGVTALLAGLGYLGAKAYQKLKSKKEEPEDKYEDKYDYVVV